MTRGKLVAKGDKPPNFPLRAVTERFLYYWGPDGKADSIPIKNLVGVYYAETLECGHMRSTGLTGPTGRMVESTSRRRCSECGIEARRKYEEIIDKAAGL